MSFAAEGAKIVGAVSAGLYAAGTRVMNESHVLVPKETGTLDRSGTVQQPEPDGDGLSVTCGYGYGEETNPLTGEPAAGYAVYVHERLDTQHAPPTQAKFLETAARQVEPEFPGIVAEAIRTRGGV